jgi:nucleotide sugar dehydrogenase
MDHDVVVIGLGYVGMPLAREGCAAGLRVAGLDLRADLVERLRAGRSHIDDLTDDDVEDMLRAGFTPTTDPAVLGSCGVVVVCVPTPLSSDGRPDLHDVIAAIRGIVPYLRRGMLVVLESTTYPGTTEEVVLPILAESGLRVGTDFQLAFSPERIDPGNPDFGLRNTPKVVGGVTADCTAAAAAFYGKLCDTVVTAKGTREAELAKLLENTYRHVNIALINEMAVFCHELGVDLWDAIECASSKPFGFQAFYPGPGVGGHCIPVDPNYLSYKVRTLGYPFRLVELAQEINTRMPAYTVQRCADLLNRDGKALRDAQVLLLGVTYKADLADQRESPALAVARHLLRRGARLAFHDPYVTDWRVDGRPVERVTDPVRAAREADLTVLLQAHRAYLTPELDAAAGPLLDTRGVLRKQGAQAL